MYYKITLNKIITNYLLTLIFFKKKKPYLFKYISLVIDLYLKLLRYS